MAQCRLNISSTLKLEVKFDALTNRCAYSPQLSRRAILAAASCPQSTHYAPQTHRSLSYYRYVDTIYNTQL